MYFNACSDSGFGCPQAAKTPQVNRVRPAPPAQIQVPGDTARTLSPKRDSLMIASLKRPSEIPDSIELAAIVAMTQNRVIGADNAMPWHIPEDLAYFKRATLGCPVIMGRKTFDSIIARLARPLPDRSNFVLTRKANWSYPGVHVAHELALALSLASAAAISGGKKKVFVIGGEEIYRQVLGFLDALYITEIKTRDIPGDAHFPAINPAIWERVSCEPSQSSSQSFSFDVYRRASLQQIPSGRDSSRG